MRSAFKNLLGSLESRFRSGRVRLVVPGSEVNIMLVRHLRVIGRLVGFRRLPGNRLEVVIRPLPLVVPRSLFTDRRKYQSVGRFSPTVVFSSPYGLCSANVLRRRRSGGVPVLLPFGRLREEMLQKSDSGCLLRLRVSGVGFRLWVRGPFVLLDLGWSAFRLYRLPEGVRAIFSRTGGALLLFSPSVSLATTVAAHLLRLRRFDRFRGKGIRLQNNRVVQLKQAKTKRDGK